MEQCIEAANFWGDMSVYYMYAAQVTINIVCRMTGLCLCAPMLLWNISSKNPTSVSSRFLLRPYSSLRRKNVLVAPAVIALTDVTRQTRFTIATRTRVSLLLLRTERLLFFLHWSIDVCVIVTGYKYLSF